LTCEVVASMPKGAIAVCKQPGTITHTPRRTHVRSNRMMLRTAPDTEHYHIVKLAPEHQGIIRHSDLTRRSPFTIHRILLKPPQLPNPLDLAFLSFFSITHVPAQSSRIRSHHLETSFDVFQQSVSNPRRHNNNVTLLERFLYTAWVVFMAET